MSYTNIRRRKINEKSLNRLLADSVPRYMAEIYAARGISNVNQLDLSLEGLIRPDELRNCEKAGFLIAKAVVERKSIVIVADYDADGATACTLISHFLKNVEARANYIVPDRRKHGYGLTPQIVNQVLKWKPELIITVDNGIASFEGIKEAKKFNIETIVTDHHLPADALPDALTIVNPNQRNCNFPSKNLCGVGVVFYVALSIRKSLREKNWFSRKPEPNMLQYLDLVALGTVADVVPLDKNNRILVHQGLKQIQRNKSRAGIIAMLNVANKKISNLNSLDLAFSLAPRLNAAGRLENMATGIKCLLSTDMDEAVFLAKKLDDLNQRRKNKEKDMKLSASINITRVLNKNKLGYCFYNETWHEGLIGILASRIKDEVHRPVIAFAPSMDRSEVKGSGRSIPDFNLKDAIDILAKRHPHLIMKYGGHSMAIGLTIKHNQLEKFKSEFNRVVCELINPEALDKTLLTDGPLKDEIREIEIDEIARGVWGQSFPTPLFEDKFRILNQKTIGGNHKKLSLWNHRLQRKYEAISFKEKDNLPSNVRAVYNVDMNNFRGQQQIQLIIKYWEKCQHDPD